MNQFNSDEMLDQYLSVGGYRWNASDILKDFDYESFLPLNRPYGAHEHMNAAIKLQGYSLKQINQIRELTHRISTTYLSDYRHHIFYHDFYDTVYPASMNWHFDIDSILGWHGYNAIINVYFEDCCPEKEDIAVTFAPYEAAYEGTQADLQTEMVYVKKNDIVLINQSKHFLHRVTGNHQKRPIMMFCVSFMDFHADLPLPK